MRFLDAEDFEPVIFEPNIFEPIIPGTNVVANALPSPLVGEGIRAEAKPSEDG
jgi:hypothetical protein